MMNKPPLTARTRPIPAVLACGNDIDPDDISPTPDGGRPHGSPGRTSILVSRHSGQPQARQK